VAGRPIYYAARFDVRLGIDGEVAMTAHALDRPLQVEVITHVPTQFNH
jgi:hypothetical protein